MSWSSLTRPRSCPLPAIRARSCSIARARSGLTSAIRETVGKRTLSARHLTRTHHAQAQGPQNGGLCERERMRDGRRSLASGDKIWLIMVLLRSSSAACFAAASSPDPPAAPPGPAEPAVGPAPADSDEGRPDAEEDGPAACSSAMRFCCRSDWTSQLTLLVSSPRALCSVCERTDGADGVEIRHAEGRDGEAQTEIGE